MFKMVRSPEGALDEGRSRHVSACLSVHRHTGVAMGSSTTLGTEPSAHRCVVRFVASHMHGSSGSHREDAFHGAAGEHAQGDDVHRTPRGQVSQVHQGLHVSLGPRLRLQTNSASQLMV